MRSNWFGRNGFLIIGILFAVIGGVVMYSSIKDAQNCTVQTTAVVDSIREDVREEERDGYWYTTTYYIPTMAYTVDGVEYKNEPSSYSSDGWNVGDEYQILYNPNDPDNFIFYGDNGVLISIVPVVIGVALIVFGIVSKVKNKTPGGKGGSGRTKTAGKAQDSTMAEEMQGYKLN